MSLQSPRAMSLQSPCITHRAPAPVHAAWTMKTNVVVRQWQIIEVPSCNGPADVARLALAPINCPSSVVSVSAHHDWMG